MLSSFWTNCGMLPLEPEKRLFSTTIVIDLWLELVRLGQWSKQLIRCLLFGCMLAIMERCSCGYVNLTANQTLFGEYKNKIKAANFHCNSFVNQRLGWICDRTQIFHICSMIIQYKTNRIEYFLIICWFFRALKLNSMKRSLCQCSVLFLGFHRRLIWNQMM